MSFDTLITICVVIYIIVSIRKAMKYGKKGDGDAKPTGWRGKLKDMAEQIKEEIEKANREMQEEQDQKRQGSMSSERVEDEADDGWWDDEPDYDESDDELELPEPAPVIRESVFYEPKPVKRTMEEEKPEPSHRNHPEAVGTAVPGLECKQARTQYRQRNRKHLRQAVIWAEILDKPLALRD